MQERDDIRQNAILRRLRSGTPIDPSRGYKDRDLYSGKEYGVAYRSAKVDGFRLRQRDIKCFNAAKNSPTLERHNTDDRRHQRGIDCDDPAERSQWFELIAVAREEVSSLPIRERKLVEKCGLRGQSIQDYATEAGITERAAAGLWHRAIARLRNVPRLKRAA